jgi:hypothetical protein
MAYKQHFIEWFSGKQLPSYWVLYSPVGSATYGMNDEVDGGMYLSATTSANSAHNIHFNDKRQYSPTGSVVNTVMRINQTDTGNYYSWIGLSYTSNVNTSQVGRETGSTHFGLRTYDSSSGGFATTDIPLDALWHHNKIENRTADTQLSIDSVLKVTKTTNKSTANMQPEIFAQAIYNPASNTKTDCRYYEAYNT